MDTGGDDTDGSDDAEKTILDIKVNVWREVQSKVNPQFTTYQTLGYIQKECISGNKELIKEVFDEYEHPYYWNIKTDEIKNSEDDDEDE